MGVKSPLLEFGEDPVGILFVVRRAHMMRPSTQALHILALQLRIARGDAVLQAKPRLAGRLLKHVPSARFKHERLVLKRRAGCVGIRSPDSPGGYIQLLQIVRGHSAT